MAAVAAAALADVAAVAPVTVATEAHMRATKAVEGEKEAALTGAALTGAAAAPGARLPPLVAAVARAAAACQRTQRCPHHCCRARAGR